MSLPGELAGVLLDDTARTWMSIRDVIPTTAYLGGGTGIAIHLRHRVSRELDFSLREPIELERFVDEPGRQTLNVLFGATRLQFLEASSVRVLEPLGRVAGVMVAGIGDLLAMKLKVICDLGELRDYFDLLAIERQGHRRVEEGIALALQKCRPRAGQAFVQAVVRGLGYLDDVQDDPGVPIPTAEVVAYWEHRVPEIVRSLSRYG
jgi:hypothetical protein